MPKYEVQIYNRSLSASEVKQLYEGSKLGGNQLASTNLFVGDTWKVGVVPYDYLNNGSETQSNNLFITGVAPNLTQISYTNIL